MSNLGDSKSPPNFPRLIFNFDGDSTTYIAFKPPITPEKACRDIEETAGTNVEVFVNSMGHGDEPFPTPPSSAKSTAPTSPNGRKLRAYNTCARWPIASVVRPAC